MRPSNTGGPLGLFWRTYVARAVRRAFRGVWQQGALPDDGRPVLLYANHTSYWDGFLLHEVIRARGRAAYCLMEERQLVRYPFLARLGAFSVRRGDAASTGRALRYARGLLRQPGATVVYFPEGELHAFDDGLWPLHRGLSVLGKASGALCVPVGLRFTMFEHEAPDALVSIGAAHAPGALEDFQERLAAQVAVVARARSPRGFSLAIAGRRGAAEAWDAARSAEGGHVQGRWAEGLRAPAGEDVS